MDNQHRKISGYRELAPWEIDLMNEIKALEAKTVALVEAQFSTGSCNDRWLAIAKTDLEKGFMAFIRAVARPNGE